MAPRTQLAGRSRMVSMDACLTEEAHGEEPMCLHDVLAGRTEDPALAASRRLDWESVLAILDTAAHAVLVCLAKEEDLTILVPKLKRVRSTLQKDKQRPAWLIREHLGPDMMFRVQEAP